MIDNLIAWMLVHPRAWDRGYWLIPRRRRIKLASVWIVRMKATTGDACRFFRTPYTATSSMAQEYQTYLILHGRWDILL